MYIKEKIIHISHTTFYKASDEIKHSLSARDLNFNYKSNLSAFFFLKYKLV